MAVSLAEFLAQPVGAVMTRDPATVHPTQRLSVVRHGMLASGGHHVPVVEEGRFIGMITPADLLRVMPPDGFARDPDALDRALDRVSVRQAMQEDVVTLPARASVRDAAAALGRGGFHGLPVIDDHASLVGVVTTSDLMRALLAAGGG